LEKQVTICSIDIAWFKGNERVNDFIISGSTDGKEFVNLISSNSTRLTTNFGKYHLKNSKARYIRLTITDNNQNNWASVSEVKVVGKSCYSILPPHHLHLNLNRHLAQISISPPLEPGVAILEQERLYPTCRIKSQN
jgi:hypothetical protein